MFRTMKRILVVLMVILVIVGVQNSHATGLPFNQNGEKENLSMTRVNGDIYFHLTVNFESNRLFSRYNVRIQIDGQDIDELKHGASYEGVLGLAEGFHTLNFVKADNPSVQGRSLLKITGDTDYICTIKTHFGSVEIKNEYQNGQEVCHEALTREHYIGECGTVDYRTVCRYPDSAREKKIRITGRVLKVVDLPIVSISLMALADGNNIWFVPFTRDNQTGRVLPEDNVTVYGDYWGLSSFYMGNGLVFGNWLEAVPTIRARYVIRRN